jgi:hypothetical protein
VNHSANENEKSQSRIAESASIEVENSPKKQTDIDDLQILLGKCGSNKNDQVYVAIVACIDRGWNTRNKIIGTLMQYGFNNRHIAISLKEGSGNNPERHSWRCSADGVYSLLD